METLKLGNIEIEYNSDITREFYSKQDGFCCDCPDCLNYVDKLTIVKNLMKGLDEKLGLDLSKDVGQGMDELMPHDNDDHHLYVIPYYISGKCRINEEELTQQQNGPIWPKTIRAEYELDKNLSLLIINTTESVKFKNAEPVLSIWLEFKTPLLKKEKLSEEIKIEKEDNIKDIKTIDIERMIDKTVRKANRTNFLNRMKNLFLNK
ncbi:MAG: hypothetical protein ACJAUV_002077 [Flavobacteriales bacterium]|jgi:hypothetical protein